jgi:hypothetical protein
MHGESGDVAVDLHLRFGYFETLKNFFHNPFVFSTFQHAIMQNQIPAATNSLLCLPPFSIQFVLQRHYLPAFTTYEIKSSGNSKEIDVELNLALFLSNGFNPDYWNCNFLLTFGNMVTFIIKTFV